MKIRHDLAEKREGGTWMMLMVPDWRLRGLGKSFTLQIMLVDDMGDKLKV